MTDDRLMPGEAVGPVDLGEASGLAMVCDLGHGSAPGRPVAMARPVGLRHLGEGRYGGENEVIPINSNRRMGGPTLADSPRIPEPLDTNKVILGHLLRPPL
ncbi:hypothetical protein NL676_036175 [Syzygium grande]|nr:hypothetical protein NL676_036175 [Syzygium grande]